MENGLRAAEQLAGPSNISFLGAIRCCKIDYTSILARNSFTSHILKVDFEVDHYNYKMRHIEAWQHQINA